jgi:L-malate glycosyltransferase
MTASRPLKVTIVAHGDTVHHRRFVRAIIDRGHWVTNVRWDGLHGTDDARSSLIAALAASAPDVVLAGPVPTVAADVVMATDCPVVVASWGSDLLVDARRDLALAERATVALTRASAVLVDSRTVEQTALELGATTDRIVRFPWGVDLEQHAWSPPPPPGDRLKVVSLRRLEPSYRIDVLIAALLEAPHVELEVLGDGSAAAELQRRADASGVEDRVSWSGFVDERSTVAALRAAHVHVSTAPMDGTSISLLQALAIGRPSIVVDNAPNREWIEHGATGWLAPVGDPAALAACLRVAHADPTVLLAMSERGRARAERDADWSTHALTLCETLESAVGIG